MWMNTSYILYVASFKILVHCLRKHTHKYSFTPLLLYYSNGIIWLVTTIRSWKLDGISGQMRYQILRGQTFTDRRIRPTVWVCTSTARDNRNSRINLPLIRNVMPKRYTLINPMGIMDPWIISPLLRGSRFDDSWSFLACHNILRCLVYARYFKCVQCDVNFKQAPLFIISPSRKVSSKAIARRRPKEEEEIWRNWNPMRHTRATKKQRRKFRSQMEIRQRTNLSKGSWFFATWCRSRSIPRCKNGILLFYTSVRMASGDTFRQPHRPIDELSKTSHRMSVLRYSRRVHHFVIPG